jgi:adhesin transport system outer membrane protein
MIKPNSKKYLCLLVILLHSLLFPAERALSADAGGLPYALKLTISKHPSVTAKLEELKSLGFDINSADAGRYPSLSVQGQSMNNKNSQVIAKLQQPLWAGGRIDGAIDQAETKLRSGQAGLFQIRRQLMEETAAIYAELLGAKQRLLTAEQNVKEHEKLLALISRRQVGSFASEADVRLAKSRLTQAQSQQEQLRGMVNKALTDLEAYTQDSVTVLLSVDTEMLSLPEPAIIIKEAENASPTLQQRMIDVELARIQADLRQADMMPALHAVLERDLLLADKSGTLPPDTRIGFALSGTIEGAGFAGYGRFKSSTALIDAAKREVESAKNDLRRRIRGIVSDRNMYEVVMKSNNLLVVATTETLDSFMRQYDAGRKSWVDVLNAQKELADARQSLEQTKSSLLEYSLRLAVVTGRLDKYAGLLP